MRARKKLEKLLSLPPIAVGGVYATNNGVSVIDNPGFIYGNDNYRYMITMPRVELYTNDLEEAIQLTKNKKRIERERLEGLKKGGF